MGAKTKIVLTERQEKWLKKHFKHTKNAEIAAKLGISETSLHRFAREYGLAKSKPFMSKCVKESSAKARAVNKANNWPPKGYSIPNKEAGAFKAGETNLLRLGKKREAERIKKCVESLAKVRKTEKARALFGLPQKTKLKVIRHPSKLYYYRWYLGTKCGYILDEKSRMAYYDGSTRRAVRTEKKGCRFYRFAPVDEALNVCKPSTNFVNRENRNSVGA